MTTRDVRQGLRTARLLMAVGSMSPLFILWAIQGNDLIADRWFIPFCVSMVVLPNAFLLLRIHIARKRADKRSLAVGATENRPDHILVYLLAMLLPLYGGQVESWRQLCASATALTFIVFMFWHLNLHYMNPAFAAFGYRIFTVSPPDDGNPLTGRTHHAVITRRAGLAPGDVITAYRLSDTVYLADDK